MYEIRKIKENEVKEALDLAMEVFLQFEAPDYKPEGVETFRKVVQNEEYIAKCGQGICPIYAAFDGERSLASWGCVQTGRISIWCLLRKNTIDRVLQLPSSGIFWKISGRRIRN